MLEAEGFSSFVVSAKRSCEFIVDGRYPPEANMARDLQLLHAVAGGRIGGILRIYNWESPAITIGHHQKVFVPYDSSLDIPVIVRPTGGGAVLHVDDITYALISPIKGFFGSGLLETYTPISKAFAYALTKIGLDVDIKEGGACFSRLCFARKAPMDVTLYGKKLMGSAQLRTRGCLLQQGVIPISVDKTLITRAFGPGALSWAISIREVVPLFDMNTFICHLREGFSTVLDVRLSNSDSDYAECCHAYTGDV
jgi:lipoate-protein ligase A